MDNKAKPRDEDTAQKVLERAANLLKMELEETCQAGLIPI